ncbi:MAG: DUF2332 family protein [Jannaschia sp.]
MPLSLTQAFKAQSEACAALGSPFMGRLMALLAARLTPADGEIAARLFAWEGDVGASGHSLPLRLAGGLHALRLMDRADLASVYPPTTSRDEDLWDTVLGAMTAEAAFLMRWLDSPPQTNELRRAAVVRAVAHWLADRHGLPLDVMELGASAGLNLNWDRFALRIGDRTLGPANPVISLAPEWQGPLPPDAEPVIATRAGVDLAPLEPGRDRLRLLAYLWPDQTDRLARMEAVLGLSPQKVDAGDAGAWLERVLARPQPAGVCRMIFHTIAWQYFPPATDARARGAIMAAGAGATEDRPLAWFGMEADGKGRGAGMTLRLWPGHVSLDAGRVDFHGRWVDWRLT